MLVPEKIEKDSNECILYKYEVSHAKLAKRLTSRGKMKSRFLKRQFLEICTISQQLSDSNVSKLQPVDQNHYSVFVIQFCWSTIIPNYAHLLPNF